MTKTRTRKVFLAVALIVTLIAAVGGCIASAYFIADDAVDNDFTIADPKVTVVEDPDPDESGEYEWGTNAKQVYLRNDSTNMSGFVRCSVFPVVKNSDGNVQNISTGEYVVDPENNTITYGDIVVNLSGGWSNTWFYKDGYFYFKYKLSDGQRTSLLVTGITLTDGADKADYADMTVEIEVLADIIQPEAITKDGAWPVTIDGSIISAKED